MSDTIKAILRILEEGTPELQIAATQVLGALKPREVAVTQALVGRLPGAEGYLERHLLTALAGIGTPSAIRALADCLEEAGARADLAAHLLGQMGKSACAELAARFDDASPEAKVRILGILGRVPGARSLAVMERALLVPDLCAKAGEALLETHIDQLEQRSRRALKNRLVKALEKGRDELAPASIAMILQVVGRVDGAGSRAILVKNTEPGQSAIVRQSALTALNGIKLTPTQATSMLDYLNEADRTHVLSPTIRLLQKVPKWNDTAVTRLRKMLSSRHAHLRLFAVRAMRSVPSREVVKSLTQHLLGESPEMSEAASESLGQNPGALEPLLRAFMLEKQVDRARMLAKPLRELGKSLEEDAVDSLAEKGCKLLISNEPKGEIVLGLLLHVHRERTSEFVVEKAVRLRRARKLNECLALLAFLAHADALDLEGRYQLALTRLLLDSAAGRQDSSADQAGDATMGFFAALVREGFAVFDRLKKESMVTPEALLRVGAHFSVGVGSERRFGSEVLHHVADKHPRQRAGEEARSVLRSEGL